jgi:lipopolysaccharide/colanic/teichoic acid biosynthesis glycosyltransferase
MSFAGPRYHACPDMKTYHQNTDDYQVCELVKPGLSGCGSASTTNDATNDTAYVQNWSIWLDAKLILQMMTNTLKKKI